MWSGNCCKCYFKDTKNVSNSQQKNKHSIIHERCKCYFKDTKNVSNSQSDINTANNALLFLFCVSNGLVVAFLLLFKPPYPFLVFRDFSVKLL